MNKRGCLIKRRTKAKHKAKNKKILKILFLVFKCRNPSKNSTDFIILCGFLVVLLHLTETAPLPMFLRNGTISPGGRDIRRFIIYFFKVL